MHLLYWYNTDYRHPWVRTRYTLCIHYYLLRVFTYFWIIQFSNVRKKMSLLAFLLTLLLTILFIATCSYCAPDDLDSDDKCDFDRPLRCIQHSRGVRDITSRPTMILKCCFDANLLPKRFVFLAFNTDYTFLSDMFVRSNTKSRLAGQ